MSINWESETGLPSINVSRNVPNITKLRSSFLEPPALQKLSARTANLLEAVRALENIEVTPERIKWNEWFGVANDGKRYIY